MMRKAAWLIWRLMKAPMSLAWWLAMVLLNVLGIEAAASFFSEAGLVPVAIVAVGLIGWTGFAGLSLLGRRIEERVPGGPWPDAGLRPGFRLYLAKTVPVAIFWATAVMASFPLFFGYPDAQAEAAVLPWRIGYLALAMVAYMLLSLMWNMIARRR